MHRHVNMSVHTCMHKSAIYTCTYTHKNVDTHQTHMYLHIPTYKICTYTYTCTCMYVWVYIHTSTHNIFMYIYINIHVCMYLSILKYACKWAQVYVFVICGMCVCVWCACECACAYACMCICKAPLAFPTIWWSWSNRTVPVAVGLPKANTVEAASYCFKPKLWSPTEAQIQLFMNVPQISLVSRKEEVGFTSG